MPTRSMSPGGLTQIFVYSNIFLSFYYVPGTLLNVGNVNMNKILPTGKMDTLKELTRVW